MLEEERNYRHGRRISADMCLAEIIRDGIPEYEALVARILADGLSSDRDVKLLQYMLCDLKDALGRLILRVR